MIWDKIKKLFRRESPAHPKPEKFGFSGGIPFDPKPTEVKVGGVRFGHTITDRNGKVLERENHAGIPFDPQEFREFKKQHPLLGSNSEAGVKKSAKYTVRSHPAVGPKGIASVGISLDGAPDPGPSQALIDYLTAKDADAE